MQFGKTNGIGLIVLGLILAVVQVYVSWNTVPKVANTNDPIHQAPTSEKTTLFYLPAVIGFLSLVGGVYILMQTPKSEHAANVQPAKTKSGYPM